MAPRPSRKRDAVRGRFSFCAFREHVSSNSRTAGIWRRALHSPEVSGRRATVIGTSGCRCNSGHVFTPECSSIAERVVGDDEAAGAIPATQTNGRRPTAGHRVLRLHTSPGSGRSRCLSSPRRCRCNSCRSFHHATVPRIGTRVSEARWMRFNSSQWHRRAVRLGLASRSG